MIKHLIGEENFRKALHNYLQKHKYSNAVTDDILNAFDVLSDNKVSNVMRKWLFTQGYPMIQVESKGECVDLKQKKFSIDGVNKEEEKQMTWKIPIIYKSVIYGERKTDILRQ
ncbi:peptidase M1-like protein, partial [Leptotrombidium deliense]